MRAKLNMYVVDKTRLAIAIAVCRVVLIYNSLLIFVTSDCMKWANSINSPFIS